MLAIRNGIIELLPHRSLQQALSFSHEGRFGLAQFCELLACGDGMRLLLLGLRVGLVRYD